GRDHGRRADAARSVIVVGHEVVLGPVAGFREGVAGTGRAEGPGGCRRRGRRSAVPDPGGVTMSGELAQGFLDDIVANIDDDTPRLVYADWLTENDQDERAEFIRVQ